MSAFTVAVNPDGQLDAFPFERAETGQREGDHIGPGPQIDDVIPALVSVTTLRDLFNQGRTGGFHRDAGQHSPRGVLDDARDPARRRLLRRRVPVERAGRTRCCSRLPPPRLCVPTAPWIGIPYRSVIIPDDEMVSIRTRTLQPSAKLPPHAPLPRTSAV